MCLQNVIRCANFERFDRHLFAERSGNKDERHVWAGFHCKLECGNAVERGKGVIRKNQINSAFLDGSQQRSLSVDTCYFADYALCFKQILNQIRVLRIVFDRQNPQWGPDAHFLTLPGGGSLMIAQKTPSSLMAFTNS